MSWVETYAEASRSRTRARRPREDSHETPSTEDDIERSFAYVPYGTAGFRARAHVLGAVCFRTGAFAALRALRASSAAGLMITASHNPEEDNGAKLAEPNGETLPIEEEIKAEALANARTIEEEIAVLSDGMTTTTSERDGTKRAEAPSGARVFVARDTRASGEGLAKEAMAGAKAMGVEVVDFGTLTTPQLHFLVWATNAGNGGDATENDYFARLSGGYAMLTERDERDVDSNGSLDHARAVRERRPPLVIDCADGVGAQKLKILGDAVAEFGLEFDLRNRGDEPTSKLNEGVGSDYVQKARAPPARGDFASLPANTRCVSVDGDADRFIYYETRADGSIDLFDGDKIATMLATYIKSLVDEAAPFIPPGSIRIGVVQTAYANGASTAYLTEALGEAPTCVPTGVKHLHHAAEGYDIGIYFESNGHGTALFSDETMKSLRNAAVDALCARSMRHVHALIALESLERCINPTVGDALSGILLVEAIIRRTNAKSYVHVYEDLPSKQTKVKVPDRSLILTVDAERKCSSPPGLQDAIDEACEFHRTSFNDHRIRAFVRPSGTEDCVRVYVEASTSRCVDAVALACERAVARFTDAKNPAARAPSS